MIKSEHTYAELQEIAKARFSDDSYKKLDQEIKSKKMNLQRDSLSDIRWEQLEEISDGCYRKRKFRIEGDI